MTPRIKMRTNTAENRCFRMGVTERSVGARKEEVQRETDGKEFLHPCARKLGFRMQLERRKNFRMMINVPILQEDTPFRRKCNGSESSRHGDEVTRGKDGVETRTLRIGARCEVAGKNYD